MWRFLSVSVLLTLMSTPEAVEAFSIPFVICSLASFSTSGSMSVSYRETTIVKGQLEILLSSGMVAYLDNGLAISELLEVDWVKVAELHAFFNSNFNYNNASIIMGFWGFGVLGFSFSSK